MDVPSYSSGSTSKGTQPQPIIDEPGDHGTFMLGTETLFLCHMPMFTMEKHMYQLILRASLPPDVMQQYRLLRRGSGTAALGHRHEPRHRADVVLDLGANPTVWFSTGNVLNAVDPCQH